VSTRIRLAARGSAPQTLDLEPEGDGGWRISLDGHAHRVRLLERSGDRLTFELDGRVHAAHVQAAGGSVRVVIGGRETVFARDASADARSGAGGGYVTVADPMVRAAVPGKVLKVIARSGARIDVGDALVIIEAMKMEHTIVADQSGTIVTVHVAEGDTVQVGTLLVTCAWNGPSGDG
jgi:biotin carboxyl carrier protein